VSLLEITGLQCAYGGVLALRHVDLDVEEGEVVALVGANGAGKTTTLRCISGLVPPTGGEIRFAGESLRGCPPHAVARRGVGHVLEGRHLFPHLTVLENLQVGAHRRRDRADIARDLAEVHELFPRLAERSSQQAGTLSGGEQQMLAIARSLMARPRLLLMDEPSVGLAPILVRQMFEAIAEIARRGTTILLVEQNAQRALELADRGCVLELGEIVARDRADALLRDERVRHSYLGVE
jgi:branched-chain amino acid transport system ATP-binding protein